MFLIEDYEYFLRFGLESKLLHISKSLYFYRVHSGSLTQSRKKDIKQAKLKIKKEFASKYQIPRHLQPIYDLYIWYIQDKSIYSYLKLILILCKNPVITLSYIYKNICRLKQ